MLLGFPPTDGYVGGGVFSSHVKLSHPLRPTHGDEHGAVVEFEASGRWPRDPVACRKVAAALLVQAREEFLSDLGIEAEVGYTTERPVIDANGRLAGEGLGESSNG